MFLRFINSFKRTTSGPLAKQPQTSFLHVPALEGLVGEYYVGSKKLIKNNSSHLANPSTFFDFQLAARKLLQHAAYGEKDKVDEMLKNNPLLLLEKGTVTDYSGRKHYQRTVYQLLLGAVDRDISIIMNGKKIKVVEGMIEMVEAHFKRLPNKTPAEIERLRQQQYDAQFPADQEAKEEKRAQTESLALNAVVNVIAKASDEDVTATNELEDEIHKIIRTEKSDKANVLKAIIKSTIKAEAKETFETAFKELENYLKQIALVKNPKFNFEILKAIYQFRNILEPEGVVTTGKHFNHKLLVEAAALYDKNQNNFGHNIPNAKWLAPKNKICWQKVLGYIERFAPACDAQIIAQGVTDVVKHGVKSKRLLEAPWSGGIYFPLNHTGQELGYNCAVGAMGGIYSTAELFNQGGIANTFKAYAALKNASTEPVQQPNNDQKPVAKK